MVEKIVELAFREETIDVDIVNVEPNIVEKMVLFAFKEETFSVDTSI